MAMVRNLALVATLALTTAASQPVFRPGDVVSFVACPVLRNTHIGRGCWLTRHAGELYFIGGGRPADGIRMNPQFEHRLLIEGRVGSGERICGGIPIDDVRTSVLPEIDRSCTELLPGEHHPSAPFFNPNAANIFPVPGARQPPALPAPQSAPWDVSIRFAHDADFIWNGPSRNDLEQAALDARASGATVTVTGHVAHSRLSNGKLLRERDSIGAMRAEKIRIALVRLGIPADRITVIDGGPGQEWDGIEAPRNRRVVMHLIPSPRP